MRPPTVLLALLVVPAAAPAQEPDGSPEAFWDVPVVTPAGQASRVSESPSTTYVVMGDELRRSGAYSLTEILRRVPGMDVRQLTATDGQLGIRGFAYEIADRVLVMVDGRTAYLDFLGSTAYEMLPVSLADIERVEVVFGPGASVYGNKAMLGTVNIITRSADDYPFVEGRVDAGLAGELRVGTRAGMVRGPWRARATGLARSLVLYGPGEERATAGGGTLSVGYRPSAGVEATVEAGVMTGETYIIPTGARIDGFQATLAYARAQARLGLGGPGAPLGHLALDLVWNGTWISSDTFPDPVGSPAPQGMTERGDTPYLQLSHEVRGRWGEVPWSFRWGGDVRLNTFESTLTVDEELVWNVAAFANGEVVLGRWRLGAGVRVDRESLAGESVSPRLTAVWTPVDGHQLRLAFNTGFNTPSLLTRFAAFPANGLPVVGARALQPERTIYGELAWAGSFTGWLRGFASVFAYRFEDWISLQPSFPPSDPPAPVPYGNNADAVEVFGGETGLEASPTRLVSGYASYAFIDAAGAGEQPYCGVEPHGSPRHKVNAGVRIAHAAGAYLTADVHWVGPSEVARLPNPPETGVPPQGCIFLPSSLDAYVTASARLGYAFGSGVDLSIAASNLFGQEVQQFPGGEKPERRVFVTLARVR